MKIVVNTFVLGFVFGFHFEKMVVLEWWNNRFDVLVIHDEILVRLVLDGGNFAIVLIFILKSRCLIVGVGNTVGVQPIFRSIIMKLALWIVVILALGIGGWVQVGEWSGIPFIIGGQLEWVLKQRWFYLVKHELAQVGIDVGVEDGSKGVSLICLVLHRNIRLWSYNCTKLKGEMDIISWYLITLLGDGIRRCSDRLFGSFCYWAPSHMRPRSVLFFSRTISSALYVLGIWLIGLQWFRYSTFRRSSGWFRRPLDRDICFWFNGIVFVCRWRMGWELFQGVLAE